MMVFLFFFLQRIFKKTSGNGGVSLECFSSIENEGNILGNRLTVNRNTQLFFLSFCLTADPLPGQEGLCGPHEHSGQSRYVPSSVCVCVCMCVDDEYNIVCHFTDGVVKLDTKDFGDRKVFVQLACAFRYGSDDLDVMGLSFRKDIWIQHVQIYPESHKPALSEMHDTLLKKAGDNTYPFTFEIPNNLPCSVSLQPGPDDKGKSCGVDFEVKTFLAMEKCSADEKIDKKDTARLIIRKIQYAPSKVGAGPKADICKSFMMSDKPVHLEASMEKDLFLHGEAIPIKIKINNESNKTVKKIKITVDQTTDIVLYSADKYTKTVLSQEFGETVDPSATYENTVSITPLLSENKEKRGLALDGRLKDEDTNLASTTMGQGVDKDMLGILVSYKIKINLMVAGGGLLGGLTASDVTVELPLMLMHSKPEE
ncbi:arrestin 3a, retinal (X-arrestin) isoform X2 [Thunnus maccoyii]|uniref:arrestin 3a, retinal (X-arrestin) isoform X2 n=1 Tax=Thunnus maccoyii TaxID=8240 RepID=UPI001C4BF342|nr:arrestin 3a, retinal (X-arrestin) isoform X2 [Thunnus maccoyii]